MDGVEIDEPGLEERPRHVLQRGVQAAVQGDLGVQGAEDVGDAALFRQRRQPEFQPRDVVGPDGRVGRDAVLGDGMEPLDDVALRQKPVQEVRVRHAGLAPDDGEGGRNQQVVRRVFQQAEVALVRTHGRIHDVARLHLAARPTRNLVGPRHQASDGGNAVVGDVAGIEIVDDRPRLFRRVRGIVDDGAVAQGHGAPLVRRPACVRRPVLQDDVGPLDVSTKRLRQVVPGEQVYFEGKIAFLEGVSQVGDPFVLAGCRERNDIQIRVRTGVPIDAGAIRPDVHIGQMGMHQMQNDATLIGRHVDVGLHSHVSSDRV